MMTTTKLLKESLFAFNEVAVRKPVTLLTGACGSNKKRDRDNSLLYKDIMDKKGSEIKKVGKNQEEFWVQNMCLYVKDISGEYHQVYVVGDNKLSAKLITMDMASEIELEYFYEVDF